MNTQNLIEIILKDVKEVENIAESFRKYTTIPPIFVELALLKVRNLYVELQILNKNNDELMQIQSIEELYPKKRAMKQVVRPEAAKISNVKIPEPENENKLPEQELKELRRKEKREADYLSAQLKYPPISNIKNEININDKIWFTKELFEGSVEKYNQAIDIINGMDNLDEALEYIDENFGWEDENKTCHKFMQLIYRRFS